jgi:hypothetical protein
VFLKAISDLLPLVGCSRVHLLEMSAEISALCESLLAVLALEWPLPGVFSEVVSQIARLLEHTPATRVHALEV